MMNPENEKPPKTQTEINQDIIGNLSSNEKYFIIQPATLGQMDNFKYPGGVKEPYVLVYRDNDKTKVGDLIDKYDAHLIRQYSLFDSVKNCQTTRSFALESGYIFDRKKTIGMMKRILQREDLDGLQLFADKSHAQCATMEHSLIDKRIRQAHIQLPMQILQIEYANSLYIKSTLISQSADPEGYLKKMIIEMIQLDFGKLLDKTDIDFKIVFDKNDGVQSQQQKKKYLNQRDKIMVTIKEGLLKKPTGLRNRLILKGDKFQGLNLDYHSIKNKKIGVLLKDLEKQKQWSNYGLMIGQIILRNDQTIDSVKEVRELFEPKTGTSQHIVGLVLKEEQIFDIQQKKQVEKFKTKLEEVFESVYDKGQKNKEYLEKCDKMIRERAQNASAVEFKDIKNVTPIFRYTSEIKVYGSLKEKKTPSSIYRTLNCFLRDQNFAKTKPEEYLLHWEYLFNFELLSQLSKIPNVTNQVLWRGVENIPDYKKGQRILFKQFNSTSKKQSTAQNFASGALFQIVSSHSGRLIQDYSYYSTEAEVLFPPYCQFEILQATDKPYHKTNSPIKTIKYFKMKEIEREPLPSNILNYILWVDDKTKEGKDIWNGFDNIKNSTVMKQLLSTKELEEWLITHKEPLKDSDCKVSMISNMTRKQGNEYNGLAGVQGIQLFRKYLPNSNVFLYIGDKKKAIEKLHQAGNLSESETLEVSSAPSKLKEFLKKNGGIQ